MTDESTLSFKHPDGKLQTVKAHISNTDLILSKIFKIECERTVTIERNPKGGLGISVKGGAEHGIPVLISRVFMELSNDETDTLQPGDAIIAVNGKRMENLLHDEVVAELRNCGPCVQLTVRPFEEAHQVLQLAGSSKASEIIDGGSGSERAADNFHDPPTIPLSCCRLEVYHTGTNRLMSNEVKVVTMEERVAGFLRFTSRADADSYINKLSEHIYRATAFTMRSLLPQNSATSVQYAAPLEQLTTSTGGGVSWTACFVTVHDHRVCVYARPPRTQSEALCCKNSHRLFECLVRDHHLHNELFDERSFCCSLQNEPKSCYYFSFATADQLHLFMNAIRLRTTEAVFKIKKVSYDCKMESECCEVKLDIEEGISMHRHHDKKCLWSYKFSQLIHSHDDGRKVIKLDFQSDDGKVAEKVFSTDRVHHLLYSIHSFLLAKLSVFGMSSEEMID